VGFSPCGHVRVEQGHFFSIFFNRGLLNCSALHKTVKSSIVATTCGLKKITNSKATAVSRIINIPNEVVSP